MSREPSKPPLSLQIARQLLAREAAQDGAGENGRGKPGAALQRACFRVSEKLRDAMGEDGSNALLARALARTEALHPALQKIRRIDAGGIHLDGVMASVEANGAPAVTAAIEAFVAALVDILGRLIGEDMATRLIDPEAAGSRRGDRGRAP